MKGLGIMLLTTLLAIAPNYGRAQQPAEKSPFPPPKEKVEEGKFPENQKTEQFKFPENQKVEKGTSAAQPLKTYSPKEKKAYMKETATQLAEIQKRIEALKVKKEANIRQRKRANMMIEVDLKKKVRVARETLAAMGKAPDAEWSGLRAQEDKAILDLQKAFSDALQFFE